MASIDYMCDVGQPTHRPLLAVVAKLAAARDLGSRVERRAGATPVNRTIYYYVSPQLSRQSTALLMLWSCVQAASGTPVEEYYL